MRLQQRPEDAGFLDWPQIAVFEGLASAFEDLAGGTRQEWRRYDRAVIADWARELLARPVGEDWAHWKFHHPDGRRNIAYKVGAWIADEAVSRSGKSVANLVWEPPEAVLRLAGYPGG